MNNGTRNWSAMTAYHDPSSKLYSLYEPCEPMAMDSNVKKTAVPVLMDGKPMRVDEAFIKKHGISERTDA